MITDSCGGIGYRIIDSPFGEIGIVWRTTHKKTKIINIVLPKRTSIRKYVKWMYPGIISETTHTVDMVCKKICKYFTGTHVNFSLDTIDLSRLYDFQKRVLLTERKIPYGWVSTYGKLAATIGRPRAARAVGTALARNPYPIIIPCHRTIRSGGSLGGYGGGIEMKKALLELEGIQFDKSGKVVLKNVW